MSEDKFIVVKFRLNKRLNIIYLFFKENDGYPTKEENNREVLEIKKGYRLTKSKGVWFGAEMKEPTEWPIYLLTGVVEGKLEDYYVKCLVESRLTGTFGEADIWGKYTEAIEEDELLKEWAEEREEAVGSCYNPENYLSPYEPEYQGDWGGNEEDIEDKNQPEYW